jgi:hypothetical protein
MIKAAPFFMLLALTVSCNLKETEVTHAKTYFDVKGYFEKEADRLAKKHQQVEKSVAINNEKETKKIVIRDWKREFSAFINADINKDSWRGAFQLSSTADAKTYVTTDVKIPVKKLTIIEENGNLKSIQIFIQGESNLYTSQDTLSYFPDSLYVIKKAQKIRLLERKKYEIIGRFTD